MRKFFKRYLPDRDRLREVRIFALLGDTLLHPALWHLNRRSAAGAVAAGLFCGLIPGPLQMLGAAVASILFRVNLPLAMLCTLYTNPFTIVPLYLAAFQLGKWTLGNDRSFVAPPQFDWHAIGASAGQYFDWAAGLGQPLALGLFVLASLLAISGYLAVVIAWRVHLRREIRRRAARRNTADLRRASRHPTENP